MDPHTKRTTDWWYKCHSQRLPDNQHHFVHTSTTVITLQDGSLHIPHFHPSRPSSLGFTTKHTRSHSSLSNGPVLVMTLSSSLVTITEHEYTLLRVRSISTSSRWDIPWTVVIQTQEITLTSPSRVVCYIKNFPSRLVKDTTNDSGSHGQL